MVDLGNLSQIVRMVSQGFLGLSGLLEFIVVVQSFLGFFVATWDGVFFVFASWGMLLAGCWKMIFSQFSSSPLSLFVWLLIFGDFLDFHGFESWVC